MLTITITTTILQNRSQQSRSLASDKESDAQTDSESTGLFLVIPRSGRSLTHTQLLTAPDVLRSLAS